MKRLFVFAALALSLAWAQPRGGMDGIPGSARAMEMIRTLRIMRMRERLELSEGQVAALLTKLSKRDSLMMAHRKAQAENLKLLTEELEKRNPRESELKNIINRMKEREKKHHQQMAELRDAMLSLLSVRQQAEFMVFEAEFEREIRRYIQEIRQRYHREGP